MTELSPAAQAVLDASNLHPCKDSCLILAAVLRAAATAIGAQEMFHPDSKRTEKEPDFRALCAKLMDRWTNGKDYWTVVAEIQGALAYDPRNDPDYDSYEYATEPIPYDTTWAQTKTPDDRGMERTL